MKFSRYSWVTAILMFSFVAGQTQGLEDSVKYVYSLWQAEQRKAIIQHMQFKESEKPAFWQVYDSYCRAIEYLEKEYLLIMVLQTKLHQMSSEEEVKLLCNDLLESDYQLARVRKQYYKKFRKALSSSRASEFMRLDDSLRTIFRMQFQKKSPLITASHVTIIQ